MTEMNKRLQPNSREVAAKVMDGEAIFINLSTGVYYSMEEVGTVIWEMIEAGMTLDEVAATVTRRYEVNKEKAQTDIERLVSSLVEEKIVIESDGKFESRQIMETAVTERKSYAAPELHIYRDMGDLLALDPPMPGLKDIPWKESDGK